MYLRARIIGRIGDAAGRLAKADPPEHRPRLGLNARDDHPRARQPGLFDKFRKRLRSARIEERHESHPQDDDARRLTEAAQRVEQLTRAAAKEGTGDPERKSVGWGKSVAGGVDLGGGRILKKKKKKT